MNPNKASQSGHKLAVTFFANGAIKSPSTLCRCWRCFTSGGFSLYKLFIILFFFIITGCKSTGVVELGQDSYYIGKKDGSPGLGVSLSNKAAVLKEARAYCASKNLEMKVLKETVTPAAPARLGSTELEFSCVPVGSLVTPTEEKPDAIIEIRER
jgi:hypothetical protein